MSPESDEAREAIGFRRAGEGIGQRHKLGGTPDWIQPPEIPRCSCDREMTFYGQLDSIGDQFVLGDCGMIYVFVCFDCGDVEAVQQCY
jgi:hypothetical protein